MCSPGRAGELQMPLTEVTKLLHPHPNSAPASISLQEELRGIQDQAQLAETPASGKKQTSKLRENIPKPHV